MPLISDIVVPLFGVGIIGYLAARFGLFGAEANRGLSIFVFNFATPALLFRAMARASLPEEMAWGLLSSYFLAGFATPDTNRVDTRSMLFQDVAHISPNQELIPY